MKNFLKSSLIFFLIIFVSSCSKDENIDENIDDISDDFISDTKYGISTDISSPLIFSTYSEEGDVNFYGKKRADGTTISVDYVTVKTEEFEDPILINLIENGRIESISSPNGEYIGIEWVNEADIKILAIAENGNQVYFQTNLNTPLKDGDSITFLSKQVKTKTKKKELNSLKPLKRPDNNLNVKLRMDGQPFDNASLLVEARGVDNKGNLMNYSYRAKPKSVENGTFSFYISEPIAEEIDFNKVCSSAENVLGKLCNGIEPLMATGAVAGTTFLCSQVGVAFNVAGLPAYGTCEVLTKSLLVYCSTLGASPAPFAPSIASEICQLINSPILPSKYKISVAIYVNGGGVYRLDASQYQNVSGPFSDMIFELPEQDLFRIYAGLYNGYWSGTVGYTSWIGSHYISGWQFLWISIDENGGVLYNFGARGVNNYWGTGTIQNGSILSGTIYKAWTLGNSELVIDNGSITNTGGAYSLNLAGVETALFAHPILVRTYTNTTYNMFKSIE